MAFVGHQIVSMAACGGPGAGGGTPLAARRQLDVAVFDALGLQPASARRCMLESQSRCETPSPREGRMMYAQQTGKQNPYSIRVDKWRHPNNWKVV